MFEMKMRFSQKSECFPKSRHYTSCRQRVLWPRVVSPLAKNVREGEWDTPSSGLEARAQGHPAPSSRWFVGEAAIGCSRHGWAWPGVRRQSRFPWTRVSVTFPSRFQCPADAQACVFTLSTHKA